MASIPKIGTVGILPGMQDYISQIKKPKNYQETIAFLRYAKGPDGKKIVKAKVSWAEDVDILSVSLIKMSGDDGDGSLCRVIEVEPGNLEASSDLIIKAAQELWAYWKILNNGDAIADYIEEE